MKNESLDKIQNIERKSIIIQDADSDRKTRTLAPSDIRSLILSISKFLKRDEAFVVWQIDIMYIDDDEQYCLIYDQDSY